MAGASRFSARLCRPSVVPGRCVVDRRRQPGAGVVDETRRSCPARPAPRPRPARRAPTSVRSPRDDDAPAPDPTATRTAMSGLDPAEWTIDVGSVTVHGLDDGAPMPRDPPVTSTVRPAQRPVCSRDAPGRR